MVARAPQQSFLSSRVSASLQRTRRRLPVAATASLHIFSSPLWHVYSSKCTSSHPVHLTLAYLYTIGTLYTYSIYICMRTCQRTTAKFLDYIHITFWYPAVRAYLHIKVTRLRGTSTGTFDNVARYNVLELSLLFLIERHFCSSLIRLIP